MQWMGLIRIFLAWAVPAVLLYLLWSDGDQHRLARDLPDGRVEFALDNRTYWSWLALLVYLLYAIFLQVAASHGRGLDLAIAVVLAGFMLMLVYAFPQSITAGSKGLEQAIWFWLRTKRVAWNEVGAVDLDRKGRSLTITGKKGTKIVHTRKLPDRDRLIEELQKYCPGKVPKELLPMTVPAPMVEESREESKQATVTAQSGGDDHVTRAD